MGVAKHRSHVMDSPTASQASDKHIVGQQLGVAHAGGGAGVTVSTVVTFPEALPADYQVIVGTKVDCVAFVDTRTTFGFTVKLTPRLAANSLSAGTFDVLVIAV